MEQHWLNALAVLVDWATDVGRHRVVRNPACGEVWPAGVRLLHAVSHDTSIRDGVRLRLCDTGTQLLTLAKTLLSCAIGRAGKLVAAHTTSTPVSSGKHFPIYRRSPLCVYNSRV